MSRYFFKTCAAGGILTPDHRNRHKGQNRVSLNVSHLPAGIYWVELRTVDGVLSQKVLVQ